MNTLLRDLTDSDLEQLRAAVVEEQATRRFLASAQRDADRALARYQEARARNDADDGQPPAWVQPTGAHDAYPLGWVVAHDGTVWESLVSGNVWMPGDSNDPQSYRWWREVTDGDDGGDEGDEGSGVSAWNPNGSAYAVGEQVTFEGKTYECRQSHTSQPGWTPAAVPALWQVQP